MNSRLVCKKCHMVFHMNTAGRAVLGEPRNADSSKSGINKAEKSGIHKAEKSGIHKAEKSGIFKAIEEAPLPTLADIKDWKENLNGQTLPVKPILIGLAAIVVCWGGYKFLFGPPESIADRANAIAQAFANDDLAYLKSIATTDSVDDVVRWFDAEHPQVVKARQQWKNKDVVVRSTVIEEDRSGRTGSVEAFIYPPEAAARNAAAETEGAPIKPVELHLRFTLDSRGKWRLNGHSMAQTAQPAAMNELMPTP